MSESARNTLLVASSFLLVVSVIPYLIDIVKKKTKPRVVSWFNWMILGAIAGFAALADGQIPAAVLSFASAVDVVLVVLLGLYYGDRRFDRFDIACQIGAASGLALWLIFNSPVIAIIAVTVIDLVAALPTYRHIWRAPHEETFSSFALCAVASLLTLIAVKNYYLSGLIYPIYLFAANFGMASLIIIRRSVLKKVL